MGVWIYIYIYIFEAFRLLFLTHYFLRLSYHDCHQLTGRLVEILCVIVNTLNVPVTVLLYKVYNYVYDV